MRRLAGLIYRDLVNVAPESPASVNRYAHTETSAVHDKLICCKLRKKA